MLTLNFKVQDQNVGLLFALSAFNNFLARIFSPRLSSRGGERMEALLGSSLISLSNLIFSFAPNLLTIGLGMIIYGLGFGFFIPASISITGKTVPDEHKALGMALFTTVTDFGVFLGSLISPFFLIHFGFPAIFLFSFILALLGLVIQMNFKF
ncbi:Gentisate transporter [archaeon HR06]|nr:Gentisate transporter [archaeon HR06]